MTRSSWVAVLAGFGGALLASSLLSPPLAAEPPLRPGPPPASASSAPGPVTGPATPGLEEPALTRPQRQWKWIAGAAGDDCKEKLAATGAKFRPALEAKKPDAKGCGVPRGVVLTRGPTGLAYSPPIYIDCSLALRLVEVEAIIQEEALAELGAPAVKAATLGSYACRGVIGRLRGWTGGISEHSFGNAFDVTRIDAKNGKRASVMKSLRPGEAPTTAEGRFLAQIARRVRREVGVRVLGPDFDPSHRDHLHFDAGSPWYR
jgi:hypothetical protein